ncbi:pitrilysin family protein [Sphingomonas swuensis]|uniref:Pitrilysin family protein n=1 Tax=Sphingomonas swuensis TaxID=977800 RepID=A0ABP7TDX9_9SPHN
MRHLSQLGLLLAGASVGALAVPASAAQTAATVQAPAPLTSLVREVRIPNTVFKLQNGLTVVVHEDRKAPIVAVSTWYNVGAKDEPAGKTGFAHLFEHLMFNGSENMPGDTFKWLQEMGATDENGTTSADRTNYFQTVPKAALDRALFLESDRMGYLLGALTQDKLDNQRGVVQNEKRQRYDNQPGGMVYPEVYKNLFPAGHPYHHIPIGSMADLDAASLADAQKWFRDNYGPNNAVLVLAGDLSAAEARPLVEKYFGAIKRGPVNTPAQASVPAATGRSLVLKDKVATTLVSRWWAVPGMLDKSTAALDLAGSVLGGLASSRLSNTLVRDEKLAVQASAGASAMHRVGTFSVQAVVRPGVDPSVVERRLDEIVADFIAKGPTQAELKRASTSLVASQIRGLEQVGGFGGKATALAEGQLYAGNANWYRTELDRYAAVTPAQVNAVTRQWLTRPALKVRLEPGERPATDEAKGGTPSAAGAPPPSTKREVPGLGTFADLDFPTVERATLSNGIKVTYARRNAVPLTQMALSFNAGNSADAPTARGLGSLTTNLLDEGAGGMTAQQIAERREELGMDYSVASSLDRTVVLGSALSANLAPSLDLLETIVEQPSFAQADFDRLKSQTLAGIANAQKDPASIAARTLPTLVYGANHPYATVGAGDPAAVTRFTRADAVAFQQKWLRPDNLEIFVVSNLPLADVRAQLESRFGNWAAPAGVAKGVKAFNVAPPAVSGAKIYLVDRPGSPQSIIRAIQLTDLKSNADILTAQAGSEVLGGNFLSRFNADLRETKGWSYGVGGNFSLNENNVAYGINAPVQSDRTGESIAALNSQIADLYGSKPITEEELGRLVSSNVKSLPGQFETGSAVLGAMMQNAMLGRPDTYQEQLGRRYQALAVGQLVPALKAAVDSQRFTWLVVGDAAKVKPQLDKLGIPVEVIQGR